MCQYLTIIDGVERLIVFVIYTICSEEALKRFLGIFHFLYTIPMQLWTNSLHKLHPTILLSVKVVMHSTFVDILIFYIWLLSERKYEYFLCFEVRIMLLVNKVWVRLLRSPLIWWVCIFPLFNKIQNLIVPGSLLGREVKNVFAETILACNTAFVPSSSVGK